MESVVHIQADCRCCLLTVPSGLSQKTLTPNCWKLWPRKAAAKWWEHSEFCAALSGAGLGFLWFNTYPAQVFMGDIGALALGAALGTVAVIVRQELVLFIMGGLFVIGGFLLVRVL